MKNSKYFIIVLLLMVGCKGQNKENPIQETHKTEYSKSYFKSLIDSLQYTDESQYEDYTSPLSKKIKTIGKPIIPYLLDRLNDTLPTKTFITNQCYCYPDWDKQPYYTIGDLVHSYIWEIYYNTFNSEYNNNLELLQEKYLQPNEEQFIDNIIPGIVEQYKKDTITVKDSNGNSTQKTNMNLYTYYLKNKNYKMTETEKRKRYQVEFIKALNKDLLK